MMMRLFTAILLGCSFLTAQATDAPEIPQIDPQTEQEQASCVAQRLKLCISKCDNTDISNCANLCRENVDDECREAGV